MVALVGGWRFFDSLLSTILVGLHWSRNGSQRDPRPVDLPHSACWISGRQVVKEGRFCEELEGTIEFLSCIAIFYADLQFRHFSLKWTSLLYFDPEKDMNLLGSILLHECRKVEPSSGGFNLHTPGRVWEFVAEDKQEQQRWLSILEPAVAFYSAPHSSITDDIHTIGHQLMSVVEGLRPLANNDPIISPLLDNIAVLFYRLLRHLYLSPPSSSPPDSPTAQCANLFDALQALKVAIPPHYHISPDIPSFDFFEHLRCIVAALTRVEQASSAKKATHHSSHSIPKFVQPNLQSLVCSLLEQS